MMCTIPENMKNLYSPSASLPQAKNQKKEKKSCRHSVIFYSNTDSTYEVIVVYSVFI